MAKKKKKKEEKKIDSIKNDLVPKGGGIPSKQAIYAYISQFTQEAVDVIVEIMRTTRNENVKLGAAKVITDKSIADKRAVEVSGEDGQPIKIQIINYGASDPLPTQFRSEIAQPASFVSSTASSPLPSPQLAQESKKDDISDKPADKVG